MSETSFKINRRKFLAASATLGVAGAFYHFLSAADTIGILPKSATRLRAGHFHFAPDMTLNGYYPAARYKSRAIFEWNFETGKTETFDTLTTVHVIETSPIDTNLSVLATKRTDRMSLFDWNRKKEISTVLLTSGYFYGHAIFTPDGRYIITSTIENSMMGSIDVLEVPTLKKIGSYPVSRGVAHELLHVEDSKFIFTVGNTDKSPPAFGFFDLEKGSFDFVDVVTVAGAPGQFLTMTHLKDCGDRYVSNVNVEGPLRLLDGAVVSLNKVDRKVKTEIPMAEHGLKSELLSFEFDALRDYAWVTLPEKNLIVVWNLKSDSPVREIRMPRGPLSISLLPNLDVVVVATKSQFFAFDPKTLKRREDFEASAPHQLLTGGKTSHTRLV